MEKMFKPRTSIYYILWVSLFAILFTVSCNDEPLEPDKSDTKDKAEYDLVLGGIGGGVNLKGENVDSNWDRDLGIVWLGNDENRLPTGTLTLLIDRISTTSGISQAVISSAALSTADQLVGTGAEINAKTYLSLGEDELLEYGAEHGFQWIDSVVIGTNYISGSLGSWVDDDNLEGGLVMKDANTGEIKVLWGSFTALSK